MTSRQALAHSYLEHIAIYSECKDLDASLLRSFATNWFAYTHGEPFLNKRGRPRWLNTPHPVKDAALLHTCHYRSESAAQGIGQSGNEGDLIVDHAIPFSVLRTALQAPELRPVKAIEQFLLDYLRLGVITREENDRLTKAGLRSKLPRDCEFDPLARYHAVGIVLDSGN